MFKQIFYTLLCSVWVVVGSAWAVETPVEPLTQAEGTQHSTFKALPPALQAAFIAARRDEVADDPSFAVQTDADAVLLRGGPTQTAISATWDNTGLSLRGAQWDETERAGLHTSALDCDGQRLALSPSNSPLAHNTHPNRATRELTAPGVEITEWYANTPDGLEQGFDVQAGCRNALDMVLDLHDMTAILEDGEVLLTHKSGQQLRYGVLHAQDAYGQPLTATFLADSRTVRLHIDVTDAAWPIAIDPLIYTEDFIAVPDGTNGISISPDNSRFGQSVSISGDTAIIGAPLEDSSSGAAYVFVRSGATWTHTDSSTK